MIQVIKTFITKIVASSWRNIKWVGIGYADQIIAGNFWQHYGLKSYPIVSDQNRLQNATSVYGNNVISIAENDTTTDFDSLNRVPLNPGNVVVYATDPGKLYLFAPELNIRILDANGNNLMTYNNDPVIPGVIMVSDVPVSIKKPGENVYYLVNEKFLTDFCNHVHLSAAPGSPTGTPLIGGIPATYPGTLTPDVTKTLKSDGQ
jgi:hypothetical protein